MGKIILVNHGDDERVPHEYVNPPNTFLSYMPYNRDSEISVRDFIKLVDKYTLSQDGDELILLDADKDYFSTDIAIATFGGFAYYERHDRSKTTMTNVGGRRRGYLELGWEKGNLMPNNSGQIIPYMGYDYLNLYFKGSSASGLYMDYNNVGVTNAYHDIVSTKKRARDGSQLIRARIGMHGVGFIRRIAFYKHSSYSSPLMLYRITFGNQREEK